MWPWWRMKGEDAGLYQVVTFAGFNTDPAKKDHLPIVILKSLSGFLNEAVPTSDIHKFFDQVQTHEVREHHPDAVNKYRRNKRR